ncbi:MAG: hypothetical protein IBJ10_03570 [Phycisphaerales bacterium]|nr:hypothetical protein [Phycisphaerales bacterium]
MLTQTRLQRSVGRGLRSAASRRNGGGGAWSPVLEDLAHNGLPASGPLRAALAAEADAGAAGAIALALRRAAETSYLVTHEVRALAANLLERRTDAGRFGGPVTDACAIGALTAALALAECGDPDLGAELERAARSAAAALDRAAMSPLEAALALAQVAGSGFADEGALWSKLNAAGGGGTTEVRTVLRDAGLLGVRRAA